jgi:transcriptional regulator with GAF, ATPase, and Fis domain
LLAQHFIRLSAKELGCPKPRLTRAGMVLLQSYEWPGNIREVRNVIERAVILARGGVLEFDLPVSSGASPTTLPIQQAGDEADTGREFLTESEMQRHERDNLLAVLKKSGWKIKGANGAAELLGVKPTTLLSRMEKMGLRRAA